MRVFSKLHIFEKKEKKNAEWLIGAKIIRAVFALVVSVITARFLGPSNYGLIGYAAAYVSFFTVICSLGFDAIIIKEFYDDPEKEGQILGTSIFFRFIASIISISTIVLIVSIIDRNEQETITVVFLCALGLAFQVFDSFNYWFQSKYNSKVVAISTLIAYIVISIYKILLFVLNKGVFWFAISTSLDYIVLAICLIVAYKKNIGPRLKVSFARGCNMLKSGYHYIISGLMVVIYTQVDRLMLKQMIGQDSVGYYNLSEQICAMWVFVLSAIIESMYPTIIKLYSKDKNEFEKKNRILYGLVFYLSVFVALCFQVIARPGIRIIYGEQYLPAASSLKVLTWYTAFSYLGVARNAWLVCEGRQKYLKYIYAIAALANVILNYLFIPVWGATGAASASLITQMLTSIILPFGIKELRPNAKLMIQGILLTDVLKKKGK